MSVPSEPLPPAPERRGAASSLVSLPVTLPEPLRRMRPGPIRLRALLAAIPLLGTLPLILFAGLLLLTVWNTQQRELQRDLQSNVRALSVAVDRELSSSVQRLEMLALLAGAGLGGTPGDVAGNLREHARAVLARNPDWTNLTLTDREGRQVLNLRHEGQATPVFLREHQRRVIAEGRAVVSDLFVPRAEPDSQPVVAVSAPVRIDHEIRYVLTARLDPMRLAATLQAQQLRADGVAAIYDRQLRIVARNRDTERFLGALPAPTLLAAMRERPAGTRRTETLDRPPVIAAWERTEAGWAVAVGLPVAAYDRPLRRSMWGLAVVGLLLLGLGVAASLFIARKVSQAVDEAGRAARLLAAGRPVRPAASGIAEMSRLSESLHQAGERLSATLAARDAAEAERGRLLASERQARAEAEAANRGKDEFLAMLGHELRNPLNAMNNGLRVLDHPEAGTEQQVRVREMLGRQCAHLKRMVDDLLDVGRVINGKIRIQREPMDLAEAVRRSVTTLRAADVLERHTVHEAVESVRVEGDAARLEQVVGNLLGNAARYTPAGGHLRVTLRREGSQAVLSVQDDGIGMSPALLARVFDLFVQGDQDLHRATGGLGIGLTLVKRLVELHGGRIVAESEGTGRGSRFVVRLPALPLEGDLQ